MTRALLLSGGPGHDFAEVASALVELLAEEGIDADVVTDPREAVDRLDEGAERYELLVVHALRWRMDEPGYEQQRSEHRFALTTDEARSIQRFVEAGGGLLALHTAVICFDADPTWRSLCGAAWAWDRSAHPPLGDALVEVTEAGRAHPLTDAMAPFTIEDEIYGFLDEVDELVPLLVSAHGGRRHPVAWARTVGAGRVVTDLLGHGPASFAHPAHRALVARSARWCAGRSVGSPT
jgi:type 1 glutamine amidotransferase